MKQIMILLVGFIVFSCSKEENKVENNIQNDRLSFQNMQEFNKKYQTLATMGSKEDLTVWAQSKNHSTLLYSSDSLVNEYSDALKTILNKDSEFELGDSIVWFNNGKLYAFPKNNEINLFSLKSNPNKENIFGSVNVTKVGESQLKSSPLNLNSVAATWQKQITQQYYQPCGGTRTSVVGLRKYVHELVDESFAVYPGPVVYSNLYLRIKLEWKGSQDWQTAGEYRKVIVNVSGSADMFMTGVGLLNIGNNYSKYLVYDCNFPNVGDKGVTGPLAIYLSGVYVSVPIGSQHWVVTMNGTIYQYVKGDLASNAWLNNGTANNQILW